jgi:hypothetical protein
MRAPVFFSHVAFNPFLSEANSDESEATQGG